MLFFSPLAGTTLLLALVRVLLSSSSVHAAAIPIHDDDDTHGHGHASQGPLPDSWYQDDDHFAHTLFRRQTTASASGFPDVGSPTWAAAYPVGTPDSNAMPQAWKDALNAAVQAGKIPNIPRPTQQSPSTVPVYPTGVNPASPDVCSWSYGCRLNDTIFNAPQGVVGLAFDDGPLAVCHPFLFHSCFHPQFDLPSSSTCKAAFQ